MEIPIRKLIFSAKPGESGVKTIAFVDAPAIMVNWIAFNEEKEHISFAIQDTDKRMILSPALIPDLPIKRLDPITKQPFAVVMDRDTVFEAAFIWQQQGRANFANEMHQSSQELYGITWMFTFVSDEKYLPNPEPFKALPIGTWFVMGKVNNDEVWNKVKSGEFKGISIEGFFDMIASEPLDTQQVEAIIESIL